MSWNGNDLFNSTLMGGMPSGADPHQYLTTDGNGKPHWEDKLAYEESTVEVILPETKSSYLSPGQRHDLKNKATKAIKIGDTGILTINGVEYAYTGTKSTDTTNYLGSAIWLKTADTVKQWVYVDPDFLTVSVVCKNGSPYGFYTFIIAEKATTLKTLDPKYLPSGSGGGGVMMITAELTSSTGDLDNPDTVQNPSHTYEEVKAAVDAGKYCILVAETAGTYFYTPMTVATDAGNGMAYGFAVHGVQIIVDKNGWMKH